MMCRLLVLFLFLASNLTAQQRYQLMDLRTNESVPFAKVIPSAGNPSLADIDGYFHVPDSAGTVRIQAHGFTDSVFLLPVANTILYLIPEASELDEVTILPGVNPAERIMERAIENRKKNHPMGDESFSYTSYSKFYFTMDPDVIAQIPDSTTDTNLIELRKLFNEQYLFLMESTTEKYFKPPYREKEIVTAYKVSGFSDPSFSTFANDIQTFNFYENQFALFGVSYVNPLAFGGIRRYLFILEDQTVHNGDTTFTIRFQPRKDKNFEGMKGWLYINSNGYALEKVIAEPAVAPKSLSAKIVQEYALIDGRKWFPVKLSTEAVFPEMALDTALKNAHLIGKGSTYIEQIKLGVDLSDKRFNAVMVETTADANEKDSTHWNSTRKYELTDKEVTTYEVIDSISDKYKLDRKFTALTALADGKLPLGYVQLDLYRLLDYKTYEGYRLGLGLENSAKLMKRVTLGGYFGYGTHDKAWKYGGYVKWMAVPKYFVDVKLSFQEDLVERGGTSYDIGRVRNLNSMYNHLYVLNMDKQRKAALTLSGYVTPRIKLLGTASYQRIRLTDGYVFDNGAGLHLDGGRAFEQAEVAFEAMWTIREKVMYLGTRRVSMGSVFPQLVARVSRGFTGVERSTLNYTRLNVNINQSVQIRAVGKLTYLIAAGQTIGAVPLYLNQVALGTGGADWRVSIPNSFETMNSSSFYHSSQLAVFTRFTFKAFRTNLKWTSPQIGIHHAMGTGVLKDRTYHTAAIRTMEKGYYEAGVIVDRIIVNKTTGIGIGVFYNYGAYAQPKVQDNLTFKISIAFVGN